MMLHWYSVANCRTPQSPENLMYSAPKNEIISLKHETLSLLGHPIQGDWARQLQNESHDVARSINTVDRWLFPGWTTHLLVDFLWYHTDGVTACPFVLRNRLLVPSLIHKTIFFSSVLIGNMHSILPYVLLCWMARSDIGRKCNLSNNEFSTTPAKSVLDIWRFLLLLLIRHLDFRTILGDHCSILLEIQESLTISANECNSIGLAGLSILDSKEVRTFASLLQVRPQI